MTFSGPEDRPREDNAGYYNGEYYRSLSDLDRRRLEPAAQSAPTAPVTLAGLAMG